MLHLQRTLRTHNHASRKGLRYYLAETCDTWCILQTRPAANRDLFGGTGKRFHEQPADNLNAGIIVSEHGRVKKKISCSDKRAAAILRGVS